jgi:hypothetical protein
MQNNTKVNYNSHCSNPIYHLEERLFDTTEYFVDGHVKMRILRLVRWIVWESFSYTDENNFIKDEYEDETK